MSADTILTVTDLHFAVGRTRILNGIDFSVPRGQTLGIIGPNGSGKTTLFNCISGFNVQQQGSIVYAGQDLGGMLPHQRARAGLGRVFQNFGVFRDMTVSENIVTGLETRGGWWSSFLPWSKATAAHRAKALEYLEEVGLGAKAEEKASSLSGGQMLSLIHI